MNKKILGWIAGISIVAIATIGFISVKTDIDTEASLTIGAILPLTGAGAEFGQYNQETTKFILQEADAGQQGAISLRIEDSKTSAKDALAAWQRLVSRNQNVPIVSTELSSISMALAPLAEQENRLLVAIAATPSLSGNPNVLRIYPTASVLAEKFLEFIADHASSPTSSISILYLNDEYGRSVAANLKDLLLQVGRENVKEEPFDSKTESKSFAAKHAGSDYIVVVGYGQAMGLVIRDIRSLDKSATIMASVEFSFNDVLSSVSLDDDNLYFMDFDALPQQAQLFLANGLGRRANPVDILVFDGINIVLQAVRQLHKLSTPVNGKNLSKLIRGSSFSFHGRTLSVDESGNVLYSLRLQSTKLLL